MGITLYYDLDSASGVHQIGSSACFAIFETFETIVWKWIECWFSVRVKYVALIRSLRFTDFIDSNTEAIADYCCIAIQFDIILYIIFGLKL